MAVELSKLEERDGIHYLEGEKEPYTGEVVEYYDNGKVEGKMSFLNGVQHGEEVWYYENGQIEIQRTYKNGHRHGEFITYFENGEIEDRIVYIDGKES